MREEVAVSQQQKQRRTDARAGTGKTRRWLRKRYQQEYAPHAIITPLAFLIKSALNTNIFAGELRLDGYWMACAARDLNQSDIGGKTGTTNSLKDAWFSGYGPRVVTSVADRF